MKKVQVLVQEGYGTEINPTIWGSQHLVDLSLEIEDTEFVRGVFTQEVTEEKSANGKVISDRSAGYPDEALPVIPYEYINNLMGRVLTVVDASYNDLEQRKAVKDLLRQQIWNWYDGNRPQKPE